ncbi:hybrid signal transduction histidine kinase M [Tanacetum coccineum]|uniref:Hybrid signal transduction histidine kinase M n=1 Tax=Tanacetum coccineum TaxID=301880 RepID=A0ABQ5IN93_9ASTR
MGSYCNHFHDNRRTRTIALKDRLRRMKLGDMTVDAYFRKIKSISTILTILGSPMSNDNIVTYALKGLSEKIDHVAEEMRLKAKSQASVVDSSSSSPMVLLAHSSNNNRRGNGRDNRTIQRSFELPECFNFAKGFCSFGGICKFVHDNTSNAHFVNNSMRNTSSGNHNNNSSLMVSLYPIPTQPIQNVNTTNTIFR